MEGGKDPFNRRTYPWGAEDESLLQHFRSLGKLRRQYAPLRDGNIRLIHSGEGRLAFARDDVKCYVNRTDTPWILDDQIVVDPMDWKVL
jgi:hypothetical protein